MAVSAASICPMTVWDDSWERMFTGPAAAGGVSKLRMATMEGAVVMSTEAIVMRSFASLPAPMWNVFGVAEARTAKPLKRVFWMVREDSAASCWNSASRLARSASLLVPLADCTASSRIRCIISPILPSAPSATWPNEMPSLALRMATFMPLIWDCIRSAMAMPAASSLALLTRKPEDRRWIEVATCVFVAPRLRWALSETRLVLMT
jgi:hypothetical protein